MTMIPSLQRASDAVVSHQGTLEYAISVDGVFIAQEAVKLMLKRFTLSFQLLFSTTHGDGKGWGQLQEQERGYQWETAAPDLVSLDQLELELLLGEVDVSPGAESDIRTLTHRQPHPPVHPPSPHLPTPHAIDTDPIKTQEQHQPCPGADAPGKERRGGGGRKRGRGARAADKEAEVAFHVSEHDLELATAKGPGGEKKFDPRKVSFKEEDLKPQPMLKKSKKVFVPDSGKDTKYWERRQKNNMAAKRSRDARRVKENQVLLRVAFLERENDALRNKLRQAEDEISALHVAASAPANEADMERMREENARLRHALSKMTEILKCL